MLILLVNFEMNSRYVLWLFLFFVVSAASSTKCLSDLGYFVVIFGSEKAYKRDKLKEQKADFRDASKYNKFVSQFYYGAAPLLCKEFTKPLTEVRYLKFENFGIKDIQAGAFSIIPHLTVLEMYDNNIRSIKYGVFNYLNVTKIILDKNAIAQIDAGAFNYMPNLNVLSIEKNKISKLDPNWFYGSANIHSIYLDENRITSVPKNAFKYVTKGHHCNLELEDTKCPEIWLQFNRITDVHPEAFTGLGKISNLMLGSNELQTIPNAFSKLHVKALSLEFNEFTCISEEILDTLKHTTTRLYFGSNLLTNDCVNKFQKYTKRNYTLHIIHKNVRIDDEDDI